MTCEDADSIGEGSWASVTEMPRCSVYPDG